MPGRSVDRFPTRARSQRTFIPRATGVDLGDCTGAATQKFVFSGQQIKSASNTNLCLGYDSPFLGLWAPRLQLQTCSSNNKQKWTFRTRNYANPVGYNHDDFIGSDVY